MSANTTSKPLRINLSTEQTQENVDLEKFVEIQIDKVRHRLAARDIELKLSDKAMAFIADKGYDPVYGARPLKRVIQQYIENPLSLEILKGRIAAGDKVLADVGEDRLVFKTF